MFSSPTRAPAALGLLELPPLPPLLPVFPVLLPPFPEDCAGLLDCAADGVGVNTPPEGSRARQDWAADWAAAALLGPGIVSHAAIHLDSTAPDRHKTWKCRRASEIKVVLTWRCQSGITCKVAARVNRVILVVGRNGIVELGSGVAVAQIAIDAR